MTITTAGVAVNITPTVTKTFFKHYYKKAKRRLRNRSRKNATDSNAPNATDEFMFDEAFHIVKAFIEIGTSDTVEAIQNFTDAPAPPIPWATTLPVIIPMESCDKAAKLLVEHLGPNDLEKLVGGEKWWQLRPLPGVQGEWIAMSNDWKKMKTMEKRAQQDRAKPSPAMTSKQRRRRNKRHERALSEIKAMRQKTESALKRRSQSFKRSSQDAKRQRDAEAEVEDDEDAASTAPSEAEVPQPTFDPATDMASDNGTEDHPAETEELDRLQRVMLYFHGGGYYFGSLATHRYQIVRYARKFGGKCFAPIYRKAPQYPWPCALQDAVASYLYLLYPPKGAKHRPVDPKKLVIAGDSAGGGLTLALLTVIRDMGLPAPAGAVLISPWCDLTHSFPSILQNTATDIIPPYGFIHKPSTLWPINATKPMKGDEEGEAKTDEEQPRRKVPVGVEKDGETKGDSEPAARKSSDGGNLTSTSEKPSDAVRTAPSPPSSTRKGIPPAPDLLWSDPITISRADTTREAIELREQIQLYATNDQLTHPLCSAVLSGSLGGLPPLYILAGDAEVLRDEIVYLAHRAAHPHRYPLRKDLLDHSARSRENAEKYDSQPTKVHLQIYDQMCHVLTAFAFTSQSRFAYRAVASFVKHVTGAPTDIKNPFPEAQEGDDKREEGGSDDGDGDDGVDGVSDNVGGEVSSPPLASSLRSEQNSLGGAVTTTPSATSSQSQGNGLSAMTGFDEKPQLDAIDTHTKGDTTNTTSQLHDEPESMSAIEPSSGTTPATGANTPATSSTKLRHRSMSQLLSDTLHGHPTGTNTPAVPRSRRGTADHPNQYAGQVPLLRPSFQSFMIRERVDTLGYLRPLEPETSLPCLQIHPSSIGCIKEGPVDRYLTGQTQWAKRFAKTARKVEKQRAKNESTAQKMLQEASSQGLLDLASLRKKRNGLFEASSNSSESKGVGVNANDVAKGAERCREKWSWLVDFGPFDLTHETPPPAAIAGRRDTDDALVLLRRSLQIRARAYGVQRKSRFWGAEDRPVRAHWRAEDETGLETSTDPSGNTVEEGGGAAKAGAGAKGHHHHRGLRVWNLLMVGKKPGTVSGKEKS
ncbi:candidate lipase/esterase [Pseudozyma hubeiensis SY62]|uniref:Candidate lipase/esterase n=1 Tax=Pseudozyma hubeiensis (strain SY62) TaxID=1305764 RepID=R9P3Y9_PSEHS|nr:candidate lipase/esterase [Pseudozyma hubeiensis SY62]GAC96163.1 candidate lipase/esterase [Pseudozyma hubeiensis SY62]